MISLLSVGARDRGLTATMGRRIRASQANLLAAEVLCCQQMLGRPLIGWQDETRPGGGRSGEEAR
jgi:hypothetical protein